MNDRDKLVELLCEYGLIGGVPGAIRLANWLVNKGVVVQSDDELKDDISCEQKQD